MDLRHWIGVFRAWLPLLVAGAGIAAGVAFVGSSAMPPTYEAKATLIVGQSLSTVNPDYDQLLVSQRLSATYATIATTRPILASVIGRLDLATTTDELAKRVRASAQLDSTLLTITARDGDAARAAAIANAVAAKLIAASPPVAGAGTSFSASIEADLRTIRSEVDATQARVDDLAALTTRSSRQEADLTAARDRLTTLRSAYSTLESLASVGAANLLSVVDPAVAPTEPDWPRPMLAALFGGLLGLLVAATIVVLVEYLDDSIKDPDAAQEAAGVATVGTIPRMRTPAGRGAIYRLATVVFPRSPAAEAYRTLRANLEFASVDSPVRTLLVTSALPAEGKTVTAANLAVAFAQAGRSVLLVDADLRRPGVQEVFRLPNEHGLTDLLRRADSGLAGLVAGTDVPNLRVLPTGPLPPNPAELLGSERMRSVLKHLADAAELVVIDAPPMAAVADAAILSSRLDGTLLVVDTSRSHRRAVRVARAAFERAGAKVLGVVLNRYPPRLAAGVGAYYSGYGEGSGDGGTRSRTLEPGLAAAAAAGGGADSRTGARRANGS
ncbi:MAG TPA: polysaccharide biosynthesis tyrosine autokinase [Candidatus Limnocylindrales bacterium]|nr:polysaccharide biosynthesis tyrosine autokinase [Candidatus Limnocylindrales bacterium]